MAQPPKPPLQLPSAEWVPINEALERIKQQPGTLLTGDLHQDLKDGRLQAARQYLILRATDRDGTHLYVAYKEEFVSLKELVSPDRSKATIYETVEDARRTVRIKQFAEAVGPSLSFEPLEISELCEKSYWETVPLVERKNEDGKWTCHIYKSHGFERFSEGFFYVRRAEIDLHYPEPRRPHAADVPKRRLQSCCRQIAVDGYGYTIGIAFPGRLPAAASTQRPDGCGYLRMKARLWATCWFGVASSMGKNRP